MGITLCDTRREGIITIVVSVMCAYGAPVKGHDDPPKFGGVAILEGKKNYSCS